MPFLAFLLQPLSVVTIDIESHQNRLLKVCYVATTSASLLRLFLLRPLSVVTIDIKSLQNRLLKVCHVPATSVGLLRLLFLLRPLALLT